MLEARALSVCRGANRIIHDANLSLAKGELVGLLGANGSGKSTLLRSLAGLHPCAGTLHLEGKALLEYPPREIAQQLSYLPQSAECHWPLSVEAVVGIGRLPFKSNSAAENAAHVHKALQDADVLHLRDRTIHELSGGERARVFLARAIAGNPAYLLMDEPGAELDAHHVLHLMELLQTRARNGSAVLLALHDLGLAARFCDRVLLMHEGRVLAEGAPETVLTPERLARTLGIEVFQDSFQGRPILVPWRRLE